MTEIALIVPVLGRPERVAPFVESVERATTVPYQIHFVCSLGDDEQFQSARGICETRPEVIVYRMMRETGPGDFASKINFGAKYSRSEFVFAGADDLCFCDGWDVAAIETARETGAGMIGTDDLWNPLVRRGEHSTHSLFRRSYVEELGASWDGPGTIYSEAYDHQWVDAEAVYVAKARGEWAFSFGSRVEHLHPFAGKSETDATYQKALRASGADRRLFEERKRRFG